MVKKLIRNATQEPKQQRQVQRDVVIALCTNIMAVIAHVFNMGSALQGPLTTILLILML